MFDRLTSSLNKQWLNMQSQPTLKSD